MRVCSIDDCDRVHHARDLCYMHYWRWKRSQLPPTPKHVHTFDRYLVNPETGCWEWLGAKDHNGYGKMGQGGKLYYSHRVYYEHFVAPIPHGLVIDHLCRVPCCVNPDHLEPVTFRENVLRGFGVSAIHARRTHCKHGHEFTPENTKIVNGGQRKCVECYGSKPMVLQPTESHRCGSISGYQGHVVRGEKACEPCATAARIYRSARKEAKRCA